MRSVNANRNNISSVPGQRPTGQTGRRGPTVYLVLALSIQAACARPLPWGDDDTRLPVSFRTPQATFRTWVQATLARDEAALRECYWKDMSAEELSAWLSENLRPEADGFFQGMELLDVRPVTLVEVDFFYRNSSGVDGRGVMVRTRDGWKLQRW